MRELHHEGKVRVSRVARGEKLPISKLQTGDVFAYDTGFHVYLWVGKQAERAEKTSAFPFSGFTSRSRRLKRVAPPSATSLRYMRTVATRCPPLATNAFPAGVCGSTPS